MSSNGAFCTCSFCWLSTRAIKIPAVSARDPVSCDNNSILIPWSRPSIQQTIVSLWSHFSLFSQMKTAQLKQQRKWKASQRSPSYWTKGRIKQWPTPSSLIPGAIHGLLPELCTSTYCWNCDHPALSNLGNHWGSKTFKIEPQLLSIFNKPVPATTDLFRRWEFLTSWAQPGNFGTKSLSPYLSHSVRVPFISQRTHQDEYTQTFHKEVWSPKVANARH